MKVGRAQIAWALFVAFAIGLVVVLGLRSENTRERVTRIEVAQAACEKPRSKECRRQIRLVLRAMRALGALPQRKADKRETPNRSPGRDRSNSDHVPLQTEPPNPRNGGEPSNPPPGNSQPPPPPVDSGGGGGDAAPEPEIRIGPIELDLPDLPLIPDLPPIHLP